MVFINMKKYSFAIILTADKHIQDSKSLYGHKLKAGKHKVLSLTPLLTEAAPLPHVQSDCYI